MVQEHSPQVWSIILAGGKGTRMKSKNVNKTALIFCGQPVLAYGLKLFKDITQKTVVVAGAYAESVEKVIDDFDREYNTKTDITLQKKRLGTGHAAQVADKFISKNETQPEIIVVGYGDHLMFYKKETIKKMIEQCKNEKAAIVMVVPRVENPTGLGRVVFDQQHRVKKIVEEKNATPEEKKITAINAGLYCFNYSFFHQYLPKLKKNQVSGEYYLTDLVELAVNNNLPVLAFDLPYQEVGIGINTREEKAASEKLHEELLKN